MLLSSYRKEINAIDKEITSLFLRRMDVVQKVAEYKLEQGMEVLQPERETELLNELTKSLEPPSDAYIRALYERILAISREMQSDFINKKK